MGSELPHATYSIDDDDLRDRPDDVEAAWQRVAALTALGEAGDAERIGWLRMLGELEKAERVGWAALARAGGPAGTEAVSHDGVCSQGRDSLTPTAPRGEGGQPPGGRTARESDSRDVAHPTPCAQTGTNAAASPLPVSAIGPALRLAHVLQWQQRFALADQLFRRALSSAESACETAEPGSRDGRVAIAMTSFARQHGGKSLFDQGRYVEALEWFTQALRLREEAEAPEDQLASTRQAIAVTRRRL